MKKTTLLIAVASLLAAPGIWAQATIGHHLIEGKKTLVVVSGSKYEPRKDLILLTPTLKKTGCSVMLNGKWFKPISHMTLKKIDLNKNGVLSHHDLKGKVFLARYNESGKLMTVS